MLAFGMPKHQRTPRPPAQPVVMLGVRLPAALHQRLKLHAVRTRIPIQQLVVQAVQDLLRRAKE